MAVTATKKTQKSYFQRPKTRRRLEMIAKRDEKQKQLKDKKRKSSDVLEVDLSAPEPPSKKDLRRAKRSGATSESTVSKPTPDEDESPAEEGTSPPIQSPNPDKPSKRSEHGIWIGNLVYSVTKADVRRFLNEKGAIEDDEITRIHLPLVGPAGPQSRPSKGASKPTPNRGFAYVDFTTSSALDRALGLTEHLLSGRKVLIKDSKSFEGRPQLSQKDASNLAVKTVPKNKRVFIGNLSFDTTEEDLMERLTQCGEVTNVHVATFEDTGKCKGYGWAEFETLEAAEAAVRGWIPAAESDGSEETEKDTGDEAESDDDDDGDEEKPRKTTRKKAKKPKKHWVNRVKGRTLRIEFAEDKATRYKKRYGKGGTKRSAGVANVDAEDGAKAVAEAGEAGGAVKTGSIPSEVSHQQRGTGKRIKFD